MLVSISLDTASEPNFAVPASPLNEPESLMRAVPSARQNASASSLSTRLHCGQRFIFWNAATRAPPARLPRGDPACRSLSLSLRILSDRSYLMTVAVDQFCLTALAPCAAAGL